MKDLSMIPKFTFRLGGGWSHFKSWAVHKDEKVSTASREIIMN